MNRISGSCLCQSVIYSIPAKALWSAHCHCSQCRKAHGAAFVTWVGVSLTDFKVKQGESHLCWFNSSSNARRAHCRRCGTPLFFWAERWGDEMHIARATLDETLEQPVTAHAFYDRKVDWAEADPHLPKRGGPSGTEPL